MEQETKREERDESSAPVQPSVPPARPSLTERVSYAWGRWIAIPVNPDDEFVLA